MFRFPITESDSSPYSVKALKQGTWDFFTGKVLSALFTFILFLWLVRLLPVMEYGAYVSLVAGMELSWGFADLGLHWLAARYLPEFRLHGPGKYLNSFVFRLIGWYAASLACVACIFFLGLQKFLAWADLSNYRDAALLYLLVLLVEGVSRLIRDSLMGSLIQQGLARTSIVARLLSFFALLGLAVFIGPVMLIDVVRAEFVASLVGMIVALGGLSWHLAGIRKIHAQSGWRKPGVAEMWRTAINMYFSNLLCLLYSHQIFILLIQHLLGSEAAAAFGFMRGLYEHISRYLPATLLFSLIRPKLVATYVGGGGTEELSRNANMAGKLSLFVLMPIVAFSGVDSQDLIGFLSGDRFSDTGTLFFGFMLALIPFSQRQILETVAVATGQSRLCTYAAASGLLMLPLMYGLFQMGLGLWAPVIATGVGHLTFNGIILLGLFRNMGYQPDSDGFYKLMAASIASILAAVWMPVIEPLWVSLIAEALMTITVFLLVSWLNKPFNEEERTKLNSIFNRRLFIW